MSSFIPVATPFVGEREQELVRECLKTGWISSEGPCVKEFEKQCAQQCGMEEGIAVSSGTAALQVAFRSLNLAKGDEVIMPSFTIISCAQAIVEVGAVPVLVDSDPETWAMDVSQIESKLTPRTKAILAVHIYGHPVDMDVVNRIAKRENLIVIEDNAEAHGGEYKGKKCGGLADISILSFYANKLVTTGEGGMVLTHSKKYADRARSLRNLCFQEKRRFLHNELGNNFRMTNIQAAMGLGQLERLEKSVERKREIAAMYFDQLKGLFNELPNSMSFSSC